MAAFAFFLAVITYLDRVCIAAAAPFMMDELHLSFFQMSVVFSAFTRTYSLFEIPSGWLGDTRGPRRVLTRIVLWWSAFTMLTGAAWGYASLGVTRFLFGAGEAGAFPNMARALGQWFPARERGQANGILFFGSRLGVDVSLLRDGAGVCGWRRGVAGHRSRTPAGRSHSLVVDVEPQ